MLQLPWRREHPAISVYQLEWILKGERAKSWEINWRNGLGTK